MFVPRVALVGVPSSRTTVSLFSSRVSAIVPSWIVAHVAFAGIVSVPFVIFVKSAFGFGDVVAVPVIVYGTTTLVALGELSCTWILFVPTVSSVPVDVVFTNSTVGALSSSQIVRV